jgi:hypothetical protein
MADFEKMLASEDGQRLIATMDIIRAVVEGRADPPGGAACLFPHCVCNSPWEKCEMKGIPHG